MTPLTHDDCLRMAAETFLTYRFKGDFVELYKNDEQALLDQICACRHGWLRADPEETLELIDALADHIHGQIQRQVPVARECAELSSETAREDCSVCVHGYDLEPMLGAPIDCAPQQVAHPPDYCCTGFRRITAAELDERTEAIFGKPKGDA